MSTFHMARALLTETMFKAMAFAKFIKHVTYHKHDPNDQRLFLLFFDNFEMFWMILFF
jgi:hypothetical protein